MNEKSLKKKARILKSLHTNGKVLILPNIWDPIGARIIENKGFPAAATASSAISSSLGYMDGEKIRFSTLVNILSRIARSVDVPVTADIESGFAKSVSKLKESIFMIIETGIAGINLEDSIEEGGKLRTIDKQCERISAARDASYKKGVHLVINARVDCFLSGSYRNDKEKIEETVIRAKAYSEAGADCIYPIGPGDYDTVKELRERIETSINILASPGAVPLTVMQEIGINRVSFGPYIFRSCMKKLIDIIDDLYDMKGYSSFGNNMLTRGDINKYLIIGHE